MDKYDKIAQLSGEPIYDVYEEKPALCDGVEIVGPDKDYMLGTVAKRLDGREGDTMDGETAVHFLRSRINYRNMTVFSFHIMEKKNKQRKSLKAKEIQ